jgi:hypothetical protein
MNPPAGPVPDELEALRDLSRVVAAVGGGAVDANHLRDRLASVAAVTPERGFPYFEVWAHSLLAELEVRRGC